MDAENGKCQHQQRGDKRRVIVDRDESAEKCQRGQKHDMEYETYAGTWGGENQNNEIKASAAEFRFCPTRFF